MAHMGTAKVRVDVEFDDAVERRIRDIVREEMLVTVHACPPEGSGVTPCCGKTPFELSRSDRMSVDARAVNCEVER
jgi:hypothetical protein